MRSTLLNTQPATHISSTACRIRTELAAELVKRCPAALGHEIAITGSVARGLADAGSDIELNFWVDKLPSRLMRDTWLHGVNATHIVHDSEPLEDGSIWAVFRYHGIWVAAGWQTITALEKNLLAVIAGQVLDHDQLQLAATLRQALPLRGTGVLKRCKQVLSHYPDALQTRMIAHTTQAWTNPYHLETRWTLLKRGEALALVNALVEDLYNALRLLFAINREWEPDWKWLAASTAPLPLKPTRLTERITETLDLPMIELNVSTCYELLLDILKLVPQQYDVVKAKLMIQKCLESHK